MRKPLSSVLLALILIGVSTFVFNVELVKSEWTGTVYIRADGSVDPPTAPIITYNNITYTLTGNITSSGDGIVVERDNIVIDGAGYTLQGTRASESKGINLFGRTNVIVRKAQIKNFYYGVWLQDSSNNSIYENIIANNGYGVWVYSSFNNSINKNIIIANTNGVYLIHSSNSDIHNNNITMNRYGILFDFSNHNELSQNNILANGFDGVRLVCSRWNNIKGNKIERNGIVSGISAGIYLGSNCFFNTIVRNNIESNDRFGIMLSGAMHTLIVGNNISSNEEYGLAFEEAGYNTIYHNNIIKNAYPAYCYAAINTWDNGYPSGGNFWGSERPDLLNGINQDIPGSDGICDKPYLIDSDNVDRYPLKAPFYSFDAIVFNGLAYKVDIISNSTVSNFRFNITKKCISFDIDGPNKTVGFSRVIIPRMLLWAKEHKWNITVDGRRVEYSVFLDENNSYIYFTYQHSTKTVRIEGTNALTAYTLNIISSIGGTTNPLPGIYIYPLDSIIYVTAIPDINYKFEYWLLDDVKAGSDNPISVLMDASHTLQAVFTQITYQLTISTTLGGTTSPQPGTYTYVNGTQVSVTAFPDMGFSFDYWLLDGETRTENPITIRMNKNYKLEAHFVDNIKPEMSDCWQDPPWYNVQPYQKVTIRVNVTDYGSGIKNVTLWYSLDNGTTWIILNMTELPMPSGITITYEATIPGYGYCTWITYQVVACDKAGNKAATEDKGYYHQYHVIPEFPLRVVLLGFLLLIIVPIVFTKRKSSQTAKF